MTSEDAKDRVRAALKSGYFSDATDLVDVSNGSDGNIHVVVVSRKFDGRTTKEKHDLIWSELTTHLSPDVWGMVSLSIGLSPEDIKAGC